MNKENKKRTYEELLEKEGKLPVEWRDLGNDVYLCDLASLHPELEQQGWRVNVIRMFHGYFIRTLQNPSEKPSWVVEVGNNHWANLKTLRFGTTAEEVL